MIPIAYVVRPEAISAWHALGGRLADLADQGRTTPCRTDPDPFTSEHARDRDEAALACRGACPALAACAAYADAQAEDWNVWAGVDRTKPTDVRTTKVKVSTP